MKPRNAAMATRPCLISAWRRKPIVASFEKGVRSPKAHDWSARPSGSHGPVPKPGIDAA